MSHAPSSILPKCGLGRGTARQCRVVEGQVLTFMRCRNNMNDSAIQIGQNVARRDPQRRNAMVGKHSIAPHIKSRLVTTIMRLAINFNAQPPLRTIEIKHERSGGMLTAKAQAIWPFSQFLPQYDFWQAHVAAQCPRALDCFRWFFEHYLNPSTMLRMVPLPMASMGRI